MQVLYRWHKRIGILVALLMVAITGTGIVLQFGPELGLNQSIVTNRAIVSLYGANANVEALAIRIENRLFVWHDGSILASNSPAVRSDAPPLGGVASKTGPVIATADAIILLTPDGHETERIDASFLPGRLSAIGHTTDGRVALNTDEGVYTAELERWELTPYPEKDVVWSSVETISQEDVAARVPGATPIGFPLDRVMLDLHTGRLFGRTGEWIVNLASVAFLILAVTGVAMALLRRRVNRAP